MTPGMGVGRGAQATRLALDRGGGMQQVRLHARVVEQAVAGAQRRAGVGARRSARLRQGEQRTGAAGGTARGAVGVAEVAAAGGTERGDAQLRRGTPAVLSWWSSAAARWAWW